MTGQGAAVPDPTVVGQGRYRTVTTWSPIGDHDPEPLTRHHDTLADAERAGMSDGCCRGCIRVEVYSPDGQLQALWDKTADGVAEDGSGPLANRWQRLGSESAALGAQRQQPPGTNVEQRRD